MFKIPVPRSFVQRLQPTASPADRHRIEDVLAKTRVILALACLVAIYLDPSQPDRYATVAHSLVGSYLFFSVVVVFFIQLRQRVPAAFPILLQCLDALFAVTVTLVSEGPSSPFFVFFFWVLLSSAFRWGFIETVAAGFSCFAMILLELLIVSLGHERWGTPFEPHFAINLVVIRGSYLILLSILLGYLSENEKQSRAESAAIVRVLSTIRPEKGLRGALHAILEGLFSIFLPARAAVLIDERDTGRCYLWRAGRNRTGDLDLQLSEIDAQERAACDLPIPAQAVHLVRRNGNGCDVLGLEYDGRRLRDLPSFGAEFGPMLAGARSLMMVSFTFGNDWSGKLMFFDPVVGADRQGELRFAQKLVRQVGPAVYSVYLMRRLRRRAGAIERTRVARELHDGAIQSIISLEMQVNVLRRKAVSCCSPIVADLQRIEQVIQREVLDLRELMQQMKPVEVGPHQLLDFLAELVERFRRDTGIRASFISELDEVTLAPRVSRELVRIAQEALVNVRKHSGAGNVLVRFTSQNGHWKLVIDDDGRGFDFAGRLSQRDLDAAHKGPAIIKERVRGIGGEIAIDSSPGSGARLEITIPHKSQAAHG